MIAMGGPMLPVEPSLAQTGSISIVKEPVFPAGGGVYRQKTRRSSNMQKVAPLPLDKLPWPPARRPYASESFTRHMSVVQFPRLITEVIPSGA